MSNNKLKRNSFTFHLYSKNDKRFKQTRIDDFFKKQRKSARLSYEDSNSEEYATQTQEQLTKSSQKEFEYRSIRRIFKKCKKDHEQSQNFKKRATQVINNVKSQFKQFDEDDILYVTPVKEKDYKKIRETFRKCRKEYAHTQKVNIESKKTEKYNFFSMPYFTNEDVNEISTSYKNKMENNMVNDKNIKQKSCLNDMKSSPNEHIKNKFTNAKRKYELTEENNSETNTIQHSQSTYYLNQLAAYYQELLRSDAETFGNSKTKTDLNNNSNTDNHAIDNNLLYNLKSNEVLNKTQKKHSTNKFQETLSQLDTFLNINFSQLTQSEKCLEETNSFKNTSTSNNQNTQKELSNKKLSYKESEDKVLMYPEIETKKLQDISKPDKNEFNICKSAFEFDDEDFNLSPLYPENYAQTVIEEKKNRNINTHFSEINCDEDTYPTLEEHRNHKLSPTTSQQVSSENLCNLHSTISQRTRNNELINSEIFQINNAEKFKTECTSNIHNFKLNINTFNQNISQTIHLINKFSDLDNIDVICSQNNKDQNVLLQEKIGISSQKNCNENINTQTIRNSQSNNFTCSNNRISILHSQKINTETYFQGSQKSNNEDNESALYPKNDMLEENVTTQCSQRSCQQSTQNLHSQSNYKIKNVSQKMCNENMLSQNLNSINLNNLGCNKGIIGIENSQKLTENTICSNEVDKNTKRSDSPLYPTNKNQENLFLEGSFNMNNNSQRYSEPSDRNMNTQHTNNINLTKHKFSKDICTLFSQKWDDDDKSNDSELELLPLYPKRYSNDMAVNDNMNFNTSQRNSELNIQNTQNVNSQISNDNNTQSNINNRISSQNINSSIQETLINVLIEARIEENNTETIKNVVDNNVNEILSQLSGSTTKKVNTISNNVNTNVNEILSQLTGNTTKKVNTISKAEIKRRNRKVQALNEDLLPIIANEENIEPLLLDDPMEVSQELEISQLSTPNDLIRYGLNKISKDVTLKLHFYCNKDPTILDKEVKKSALNKIELIFNRMVDNLSQDKPNYLKIPSNEWENVIYMNNRIMFNTNTFSKTYQNRKHSRKKFNSLIFVFAKIAELHKFNITCTKRELYYQYKQHFQNQGFVNVAVNDACKILNVPPWQIGILSTSKSLIFGNVTIETGTEKIYCNVKGGCLIPQNSSEIIKISSPAYFVLIVEKDAIFQKLLDENLPNKLTRPFLMFTGKGYADVNARLFLKKLLFDLRIPAFILVDGDPFGIEIMLTYRFGSMATNYLNEYLAIPNLRWIGIHPSEILALDLKSLEMTKLDFSKTEQLLNRPYMTEHTKIQEQLQFLRNSGIKSEIEGLMKYNHFISDIYLPNKFHSQDYI